MTIVAFSLLNKNSNDNQFFIKYYNEFLHDYTFKLFNLKLNIGMNKSFYLVNHDAKFLKKLLEYFEIANGGNLHPASQSSEEIVALVAAKVGNTRLIDNVMMS